MKVLLLKPYLPTHYIVPPLGLGYLATALRSAGHTVNILHCTKESLQPEDLPAILSLEKPDVVGFQAHSCELHVLRQITEIIQQSHPEILLVAGGPHPSAAPEHFMESIPAIDFAFRGEAERSLVQFLEAYWQPDQNLDEIPGLIWRGLDGIQSNEPMFVNDLDTLGMPAWDLLQPQTYPQAPHGAFFDKFPIAPIMTTRGCPFKCTFCGAQTIAGRKIRRRSIPHIMGEIELLYSEFSVRELHIVDDAFIASKAFILEFCEAMSDLQERGINPSLAFPNGIRLDNVDEEILTNLKRAGLYSTLVGIESGSQRILDAMKKGLTLELIEERVRLIKKAGLNVHAFFIVGFPGETEDDIQQTIDFAKKLPLDGALFSAFLPLPGTEITEQLLTTGELPPDFDWNSLFYSRIAYTPEGISKEKLKSLQRQATLMFYLRPKILISLPQRIKSWYHFKTLTKKTWDNLFMS
jgi:radical SAM superfamily enzyme YgiQ (UPF0313 family)